MEEIVTKLKLNFDQIKNLKGGEVVRLSDGKTLSPDQALEPSALPRSYTYCSDTMFDQRIIPWIENTSLLYHEATFLHELEAKAKDSMHSTALQAGTIAHLANAHQLLIGHFSSRYDDLTPLRDEARTIFHRTEVAEEGQTYPILSDGIL